MAITSPGFTKHHFGSPRNFNCLTQHLAYADDIVDRFLPALAEALEKFEGAATARDLRIMKRRLPARKVADVTFAE